MASQSKGSRSTDAHIVWEQRTSWVGTNDDESDIAACSGGRSCSGLNHIKSVKYPLSPPPPSRALSPLHIWRSEKGVMLAEGWSQIDLRRRGAQKCIHLSDVGVGGRTAFQNHPFGRCHIAANAHSRERDGGTRVQSMLQ